MLPEVPTGSHKSPPEVAMPAAVTLSPTAFPASALLEATTQNPDYSPKASLSEIPTSKIIGDHMVAFQKHLLDLLLVLPK